MENIAEDLEERTQSKTIGMIIIAIGVILLGFSMFYLPFIIIAPKSFCFYFSLGSSISIIGLSVMLGHRKFFPKLFNGKIKYFSIAYFLSLFAGIYFSTFNQNYLLAMASIIVEVFLYFNFF